MIVVILIGHSVKTSKKKFKQKVKAMKVWLYENRDIRVKELMEKLRIKLLGHYRYYGVSHNNTMISTFRDRTLEYLLKILNRRSNRKSYNWEGFNEMLKYYKLPYQRYTLACLIKNECYYEEPYAGKLHIRFCIGACVARHLSTKRTDKK